MIFVTIGTQVPFDRLIKAVDEVFPYLECEEIIVQAPLESYVPIHFKTIQFIAPLKFNEIFNRAEFVISHAGMGTILSAMSSEKKLLIMPRKAKFGEHRNDHQVATANKFKAMDAVNVAEDEKDLQHILKQLMLKDLKASVKLGDYASEELILSLKNFISDKN